MILIEGIKNRITTEPFITGNATVAIEIVEQENFLNCMTKCRSTLHFSKSMGKLLLQGFNRLTKAFDAFAKLVGRHAIFCHKGIKTLTIQFNFLSTSNRIRRV